MGRSVIGRAIFCAAFGVLTACGAKGGSTTATPAPPPPASDYVPPPIPTDGAIGQLGMTGPDKPWPSMTYEEKEWYMIGKVHPIMRQIFQTYNEAKYEGLNFECTPCHGENAKEKKYKMPSDDLSPVPPLDSQEFKDMSKSKLVRFMMERVTPVTAHLLGTPPYDANTKQGFSCYGCHPQG